MGGLCSTLSIDNKIGLLLLSLGIPGMLFSVFYESTVLAFIGLTLAFWGCLFLLVLHGKYVKTEVMDYMSSSSLTAVDQIIANLNLKGKPVYIPVPREVYLPYQVGAKNEFVYIPKRDIKNETAIRRALMKNPKGLRLTPPGLALVNVMEKKSRQNFHNLDLNSLTEVLSPLITQELGIAEKLEISLKESLVHTEIRKPLCEHLCKEVSKMQYLCPYIGCPVSSSIACILTRVTNKPVIIERCSIKNNNIETWYRIL